MVLGIDVGYSPVRRTTCFCALEWSATRATLQFRLTTSSPDERAAALDALADGKPVKSVAIDGPLASGLKRVSYYRAAESLLSRGALQRRGKPGQTSSPVGQQLHEHATELAALVLARARVDAATHAEPIDSRRIVEAFPTLYLAALLDEHRLTTRKRNKTDVYWSELAGPPAALATHIQNLLPGRVLDFDLLAIGDHDHRAGVVCALTALVVAAGDHVAVGDGVGGDIMLPPRRSWGRSAAGHGSWLEPILAAHMKTVRASRGAHATHKQARVLDGTGPWPDG